MSRFKSERITTEIIQALVDKGFQITIIEFIHNAISIDRLPEANNTKNDLK